MIGNVNVAVDGQVWRYMGLSRFLWFLQQKCLWLSRADLLGDPWEIPLAGDQLKYLQARQPIAALTAVNHPRETFEERTKRIITLWRQTTYVSCWCASEHESHALWRVYCGSTEGVAIQTTVERLCGSTSGLPVLPVRYEEPGKMKQTPTLSDLVTIKRPMFAYESEVRVVGNQSDAALKDLPERSPGFCLTWDPEMHLEAIYIHPEADAAFMDAVVGLVKAYSPRLIGNVMWSKMRDRPPV